MKPTFLQCTKCGETFRVQKATVKALGKAVCPKCGHKRMAGLIGYGLLKTEYYRDEHGTLRRKNPKVKLSKKRWRKLRLSTV